MELCSRCEDRPRRSPRQRWCRECHAANMRKTRPKHRELTPEQRKRANCRSYTNTLITRGKLIREPCEECGAEPAEAHHPDYDNPRLVHWKCLACHRAHHEAEVADQLEAIARSLPD